MKPTITLIDRPEPHTREAIVRPLIVFNNTHASQPEDYRSLVMGMPQILLSKRSRRCR